MGNCQGSAGTGSTRVTSYGFYRPDFEDSLEFADLIEFNRGAYSHWGMYYEKGLVIHLHIAEGHELEAITDAEGFVPASVKCEPLKDVAGVSLIRVNNKPKYKRQPRRPDSDTSRIMKILLNPQGHAYSYCLLYFNCEHFATFMKFEGVSKSDQIIGWNRGNQYLSVCQKDERQKHDVRIFNTLAYLQWLENVRAADEGREPKLVLEEGIKEIDACRQIVKQEDKKRLSFRRKINYEGAMQKFPGENPILFSPEFREIHPQK